MNGQLLIKIGLDVSGLMLGALFIIVVVRWINLPVDRKNRTARFWTPIVLFLAFVVYPVSIVPAEEIYWKLGEPDIEFWHGVDEGFRGRKPIDKDFLDHHRGDRAQ